MVIERAENDTNLSVRKKVIQILSLILDLDFSKKTEFDALKQRIIKILISKWSDSRASLGQIRTSLVNSIQKIVKTNKPAFGKLKYQILFDIVEHCFEEDFAFMMQQQHPFMTKSLKL